MDFHVCTTSLINCWILLDMGSWRGPTNTAIYTADLPEKAHLVCSLPSRYRSTATCAWFTRVWTPVLVILLQYHKLTDTRFGMDDNELSPTSVTSEHSARFSEVREVTDESDCTPRSVIFEQFPRSREVSFGSPVNSDLD